MKITLISHGETITYTKAHSMTDEWKWNSSRGVGKTGLSKGEVDEQIDLLLEKGFEYSE